MNLKQLRRKAKKQRPKGYAKAQKLWDIKIMHDVMNFIVKDIGDNINTKYVSYNGDVLEEKLWKILRKVRAITLREK